MTAPQEVEYTVVLIFPGFGAERENAETIVEGALEWLNANRLEPGFRFAPTVRARLETVPGAEQARDLMDAGEPVALVIMHDLDDGERDDLSRDCAGRDVAVCHTVQARRSRRRDRPLKFVLRREPAEVPAHQVAAATLTDAVDDGEETASRVGELIAVMALGVMTHHWRTIRREGPPDFGEREP